MRTRLLVTSLALTMIVLAALGLPLGATYADREEERLVASVERSAHDLAAALAPWITGRLELEAEDLVEEFQATTGGRVVVVDASGRAMADTEVGRGSGEDFLNRPEVAVALAGRVSTGVRASATAGQDLIFVAVPARDGPDVVGALRVTYPRTTLDERIRSVWLRLGGLAAAVLALTVVLGWVLARAVSEPVAQLEVAASRMAAGDLSARVGKLTGPPELRRLAVVFDSMATHLDGLMSSQRDFVADASHQLRTPLTALRLRLDAIASGRGDDRSVEAASREVDRLSMLVDGLLAVARLEAKPPDAVATDIDAVVRARAQLWEPLLAEEGVHLSVTSVPAFASVVPDGLEQILDNLLANALDVSSPMDTLTLSVEVSADWIEVRLVDQGPGLENRQIERMFDRFWRAADAAPGGSGLGLSIVAELARASGGSASARHGPDGVGLDVGVAFPAVDRRP